MEISTLLLFSSNTIYILITCISIAIVLVLSEFSVKRVEKNKLYNKKINNNQVNKLRAPGPKRYPIIGNLISLDGYEVPYQAFNDLSKTFGSIISLQLGSVPTIVVNGIENIKEVLIQKSDHFDSRPNFRRYHQIFCGDKENSLAFCDWSDIQKLRRDMLIQHTFPKTFSIRFQSLNNTITEHMQNMISDINETIRHHKTVPVKPVLLETCANIFFQYLCSRNFTKCNYKFQKMIRNFDKIFYEVNQGYAADFLPFLLPLHHNHLKSLESWSHEIREFILENVIENRFNDWATDDDHDELDYVDSLIDHVQGNGIPSMEWETALFALEDMVGGHSAVGNFLVKVLGYLVQNPVVQKHLQDEADKVTNYGERNIDLSDRTKMPYTEATIMEALRMISSPIVPHVANRDSTIGGYAVDKNTLVFLNNYDLSMSSKYWTNPELFDPSRFLQSGRLVKPDYFLPFGGGRRSCMGYKMVQYISFCVISTLMQKFTLKADQEVKIPVGSLAMPEKSYELSFHARHPEN